MSLALIGNLDTTELMVVVIAAVLIFGRKLPQVAAQAGAQIGKLRRQLDSAWRDSGVDREVREVQRSIESIRDSIPRDISPASIARTAATEFQRRVEINQSRLEETASAPSTTAAGATPPVETKAEAALTDPIVLPRALPHGVEPLGADRAEPEGGSSAPRT